MNRCVFYVKSAIKRATSAQMKVEWKTDLFVQHPGCSQSLLSNEMQTDLDWSPAKVVCIVLIQSSSIMLWRTISATGNWRKRSKDKYQAPQKELIIYIYIMTRPHKSHILNLFNISHIWFIYKRQWLCDIKRMFCKINMRNECVPEA